VAIARVWRIAQLRRPLVEAALLPQSRRRRGRNMAAWMTGSLMLDVFGDAD
jgi:hypothetical protein